MAENIDPNTGAEDLSQDGKPAIKPEESKSATVDEAELARREQQSKKDRALADKDETTERLDFLESREMERVRDAYISDFLKDNAEKYPHIKPDDLRYAGSKEEIEELATHLENRYKDMEQSALANVQGGSNSFLTDEQIEEQEKTLEKHTAETGQSTFSSFIGNLQKRKRS